MKNIYQVVKRPRLTEKSISLQEKQNQIVLRVDNHANKGEIKKAVESLFDVKVEKVRTANMHGQSRRMGKYSGRTVDWKKAYVSLSSDSKLDFLEDL